MSNIYVHVLNLSPFLDCGAHTYPHIHKSRDLSRFLYDFIMIDISDLIIPYGHLNSLYPSKSFFYSKQSSTLLPRIYSLDSRLLHCCFSDMISIWLYRYEGYPKEISEVKRKGNSSGNANICWDAIDIVVVFFFF